MFDRPGDKLKAISMVYFVLAVIGALLTLIGSVISQGVLVGAIVGLIGAAISLFAAWMGAIVMMSLAAAASSAENAEYYAKEALQRTERILSEIRGEKMPEKRENAEKLTASAPVAPVATNPDGKIPAWKRVQQEGE